MEACPDLNIDTIYTVIYKEELPYFRFDNPGRDWDGFVLFTDGAARFQVISLRGPLLRVADGRLRFLRRLLCGLFRFFRRGAGLGFLHNVPVLCAVRLEQFIALDGHH